MARGLLLGQRLALEELRGFSRLGSEFEHSRPALPPGGRDPPQCEKARRPLRATDQTGGGGEARPLAGGGGGAAGGTSGGSSHGDGSSGGGAAGRGGERGRREEEDEEASARALRGAWGLLGAGRGFRSSAVSEKCHAARVRPRKGNQPVSYEEAHPPHHIAHRKGWLSLHTGNLNGETDAAERTVEDIFIRKFLFGTFHGCLADEIVLKRRANTLIICAILMQNLPPHKIYFLVGYTEVLLSFFYKCPVKMEVQTISEKIIYKCL